MFVQTVRTIKLIEVTATVVCYYTSLHQITLSMFYEFSSVDTEALSSAGIAQLGER